jgi:hypothetical protein
MGPEANGATGNDGLVSSNGDALAEVLIDVNPTNPHNLVICGHSATLARMATWYSFDSGRTWTYVAVGDAQDHYGNVFRFDPALAFDADGNVYVAYGATHDNIVTGVVVCKSKDGGKTYTQCTTVWDARPAANEPGNDKWCLATGRDPVVPGRQNVYIAWTWNLPTTNNLDQQVAFSRSIDGGATFSMPMVINDNSITGRDRALYCDPSVGPNGEVYVSWHDFDNSARIMCDRSFDGGLTWGTDVVVSPQALPLNTPVPAQPDRGVSSGPVMDVDVSNSAHRGRAYITYCQPGGFGLDIMLRHSDDQCATWSAPVRVNDDATGNDQFLPYLDVSPKDGTVALSFYDAREDPSNRTVKAYAAVSHDGGSTFDPNYALADEPSNNSTSNLYRYGGDFLEYIGVAAWDCATFAVWTDARGPFYPGWNPKYMFDRVSFDSTPPEITCPNDLELPCEGNGGVLVTDPRIQAFMNSCVASDDIDPSPALHVAPPLNNRLYPGKWLFDFEAVDIAGNRAQCYRTVRITDLDPPHISVKLTPDTIWPPDHRMVDVHAVVSVHDDCGASHVWWLDSVTSDEVDDDAGSGSTEVDVDGVTRGATDPDFRVRAERNGSGSGRHYRVVYVATDGTNEAFDTVYVTVPHDQRADNPFIENGRAGSTPAVTLLHDARPNPFNPETSIAFDLAASARVRLVITDVHGARVRTVLDENRPTGTHTLRWNGRDDAGNAVASGIYFVRMQAGAYSSVRKLVLLK